MRILCDEHITSVYTRSKIINYWTGTHYFMPDCLGLNSSSRARYPRQVKGTISKIPLRAGEQNKFQVCRYESVGRHHSTCGRPKPQVPYVYKLGTELMSTVGISVRSSSLSIYATHFYNDFSDKTTPRLRSAKRKRPGNESLHSFSKLR